MKLLNISAVLLGLISVAFAATPATPATNTGYGGAAPTTPGGKTPPTPPKTPTPPTTGGGGATPPTTGGGGGQAPMPGYPTMDVPPPTNQPFFRKIDMSKIPNIPPRKNVTECPPRGSPDPNCVWSCTQCIRTDTDVNVCPKVGDWAITFDDGPASASTGTLLNTLAAANKKGTFFIVGSRVVEFPQTLKRTYNDKHQIGVHTWSHTPLTTQTNEQVIAEILWTEKIINDTLGVVPKYMRPPFGDVDDRIRNIMKQLGYIVVLWNRDTGDFNAGSGHYQPQWIAGNFSAWVASPPAGTGSMSLDHDIHTIPVKAFPEAISILEKAKQNIQPLSGCLGDAEPYQKQLGNSASSPTNSPTGGAGGAGGASGSSGSGGSGGSSNGTDGSVKAQSTSDANSISTLGSLVGVVLGLFVAVVLPSVS